MSHWVTKTLFVSSWIPLYYYLSDSRAAAHKIPLQVFHTFVDAETSHRWAIWMAKQGFCPKDKTIDDPKLHVHLWNFQISNPIGLAAGFDKHGEAMDALFGLGFGTVEIGSVCPQPQPGNPLPRMFRLPLDHAVINRYGFNSVGAIQVQEHLIQRVLKWNHYQSGGKAQSHPMMNSNRIFEFNVPLPRSLIPNRLLGINLGKNKSSPADSHQDYIDGIKHLGPFADYLVINISSPNTPGLRALQRREPMMTLLGQVKEARDAWISHKPPLLVKIAPDLSNDELDDVCSVIQDVGIDGIIVSNTTLSRPSHLKSDPLLVQETGGLSGPPVFPLALEKVRRIYEKTRGSIPIVGCGGVQSAQEVIAFAKAGASLVQLYTSLGYQGPGMISQMKRDLAEYLAQEQTTWTDLIGSDFK